MALKETKSIKVGPKLIQVLEKQKVRIEKELYGVRKASYYEAGEIIAMKITGEV